MSEHTETPWVAFDHGLSIADKDGYMVVTTMNSVKSLSERADNIRHIVHCINNHERLVEALRLMINLYESEVSDSWGETITIYDILMGKAERARTLLAALEAEKGGEL